MILYVYMYIRIYIYVYSGMIARLKLINIFITSHSKLSVCMVRTLKIYSQQLSSTQNCIINYICHAVH